MPAEVKIKSLVELDAQSLGNALVGAAGDSFLYGRNPMFARIRDLAIHLGYRFACDDTPLWRDYQGLPLLTLNRILDGKIIPFFDNGNVLTRLMESDPEVALPPQFIVSNVKHNHAFHESAHCVAHTVIGHYTDVLAPACRSDRERFVLEAILVESFANTIETLGAAEDASVSHAVFYALNSYMLTSLKTKKLLERSRDALGPVTTFLLVYLSYVESNFAAERANDATYGRVRKTLGAFDVEDAVLKEMVELGFGLSQAFRENTTPVYFRLLGYEQEYLTMAQPNSLEDPERQSAIQRMSLVLADLGLCGIDSSYAGRDYCHCELKSA
jgi:hypothetical protein